MRPMLTSDQVVPQDAQKGVRKKQKICRIELRETQSLEAAVLLLETIFPKQLLELSDVGGSRRQAAKVCQSRRSIHCCSS
jgi:hypothetical protein